MAAGGEEEADMVEEGGSEDEDLVVGRTGAGVVFAEETVPERERSLVLTAEVV